MLLTIFQFYYGSINRDRLWFIAHRSNTFQFYYGSINRYYSGKDKKSGIYFNSTMVQLIGKLSGVIGGGFYYFNSTMVQLIATKV